MKFVIFIIFDFINFAIKGFYLGKQQIVEK